MRSRKGERTEKGNLELVKSNSKKGLGASNMRRGEKKKKDGCGGRRHCWGAQESKEKTFVSKRIRARGTKFDGPDV